MVAVHGRPRMLLSRDGRKYREAVLDVVLATYGALRPLSGRLEVALWAAPPDRRRRDLDNVCKAILDAMTHAAVWTDDEQIDVLMVRRAEVAKPGSVTVYVRELA